MVLVVLILCFSNISDWHKIKNMWPAHRRRKRKGTAGTFLKFSEPEWADKEEKTYNEATRSWKKKLGLGTRDKRSIKNWRHITWVRLKVLKSTLLWKWRSALEKMTFSWRKMSIVFILIGTEKSISKFQWVLHQNSALTWTVPSDYFPLSFPTAFFV